MVQDHQKAQADILRQPGPEHHHPRRPGGGLSQEPQGVDPRRKQHPKIDGQIDRRHADVPGHPVQQAAQGQHMGQQGQDGPGPVQALLRQPVQLDGQQEQEGEFHNLRRLEVEHAPRQGDPALVARAVVVAQGDQQQEQDHVEDGQQPPQPLQQPPYVQGTQQQAQGHPHRQGNGLLACQALEVGVVTGGAEDQGQAVQGRRQAEKKQGLFPSSASHGPSPPLSASFAQKTVSPYDTQPGREILSQRGATGAVLW